MASGTILGICMQLLRLMRNLGFLFVLTTTQEQTDEERLLDAKTAIDYVNNVKKGNCTGGTENTLKLNFDHTRWDNFASIAIKTANLLTKLIVRGNGVVYGIDDVYLYSLVRNNIQGDDLVFGSAIAFEEYVYSNYLSFCPYAFQDRDVANAFDLALSYNYSRDDVEWYASLKKADFTDVTVLQDVVKTGNLTEVLYEPMAELKQGHWTYPYFDCGGGDIWMVTYSSPIFDLNNDTGQIQILFKGVATIDIELTNIDVNQCDTDQSSSATNGGGSLDVFRGTHSCQPTTKCSALVGYGFRRGSYECVCEDGYYFPHLSSTQKSFNGSDIEVYYDRKNVTGTIGEFQCIKCARGCDTCTDPSPCMIEYNVLIRIVLLMLSVLLLVGIGLTSFYTHRKREERVIKSASPIFLQITLLGSAMMICQMFWIYEEPTDMICMIIPWFAYIGFALAYGALLLKTWRIATIFRVGSAKKINLPDKVLLQRLVPLLLVAVGSLIAWTAVSPSTATVFQANNQLKFVYCKDDWWLYAAKGAEVVFLLWGVYLSFTVRKAPSQFNESKFITWSIYNAIILGTFMVVITQSIALSEGPDMVYAMTFLYLQIRVTLTLCLFFAPKFYSLYKVAKHPELAETDDMNARTLYRTTIATMSDKIRHQQDVQVQTAFSWIQTDLPRKLEESGIVSNNSAPRQPSVNELNNSNLLRVNQVAPHPTSSRNRTEVSST